MIVEKIDKPWGWELIFAKTDMYVGKILFIEKGQRSSLQYHRRKHETLFMYSGHAVFELEKFDDNKKESTIERVECMSQPAVSFVVTPYRTHRVTAVEDTLVIEVSTNDLDDVRRIEDDYGRGDEG